MTFSIFRFFALTAAFLVGGLIHAHAAYKEAWVVSFCKDAEIYQEMHDLAKQGDVTAVFQHYSIAVQSERCIDVTRYGVRLAFLADDVVNAYDIGPDGRKMDTLILSGHMIGNDDTPKPEKVFIWIEKEKLHNYEKSSIPSPQGPPVHGLAKSVR